MRELTAAVATAPGTAFEIHQLTLDAPRDDEVVVRIAGVGICHSDIAAREQQLPVPLPAVLGHEGSGVVEFVGKNVSDLSPGDNVVLSFLSCGACFTCSSGNPSYCERGFLPQNFPAKEAMDPQRSTTMAKRFMGTFLVSPPSPISHWLKV